MTFFVVAPSYQWFESWCRDRDINPRDKHQVRYVREIRDVEVHHLSSEEQIIDLGPFDPKRYELVLALANRVRAGKSVASTEAERSRAETHGSAGSGLSDVA